MIGAGTGLAHLSEKDLKRLLSALHKQELACPVNFKSLAMTGLSYLQDKIDFLQGLDEPAVRAVLIAVLAERRKVAQLAERGG